MAPKKQFPDVITVSKQGKFGKGEDIQKAIDKALKSKKHCTVYVPCGKWMLDEPLRLHPKPSLTPEKVFSYIQDPVRRQHCIDDAKAKVSDGQLVGLNFSVHLTGARPAFGGQGTDQSFTVLECNFKDAPAIDIQATRATTVSNLAIEGQNRGIQSWMDTEFSELHRDNVWIDDGVTEDHVAIAIDRLPGTGSSIAIIDNVNARYFAAGITIGTSGNSCTLNSEGHLIRRFHGQYLGRAGIILGQHQTKGITVTDSFFYGQQYWIDCIRDGLKEGFPPTVTGCFVGGTQRLFNLHHAYGQFACHGLFAESFLSIGTLGYGGSIGNLPAVFTGCQFNFFQQASFEAIDTQLVSNKPVLFQACGFHFNRTEAGDPTKEYRACFRVLNGQQVVFDTCTFAWRNKKDASENEGPPLAFNVKNHVVYRSCSYSTDWVKYVDGKPEFDLLKIDQTVNNVSLQKLPNGSIQLTLTGLSSTDIEVGDFIGKNYNIDYPSNYWFPLVHAPIPNPNQKQKAIIPFATVREVSDGNNGVLIVILDQVATTIYQELNATKNWELLRWRSVIKLEE